MSAPPIPEHRRDVRGALKLVVGLGLALVLAAQTVGGQGTANPIARLANTVNVALVEYALGVDDKGQIISQLEYSEAVDFLSQARSVAERLPSTSAAARPILDSIIAAVDNKRPVAELKALAARFTTALGSAARLELPTGPLDIAAGRELYGKLCASCHGERGLGDGPAAATLPPPKPPAVGSAADMADVSPATMFRKISVGVTGTAMVAFDASLDPTQRWNIVLYLASLRASPAAPAEGEGMYTQSCAGCHGANGGGDGPFANGLTRLPPEIGTLAWQADRSDADLERVILHGMPGTPMPPANGWTPRQAASVVAYVRMLPLRATNVAETADDTSRAGAPARIIALLNQALTAAASGRADDAKDHGLDAYLAFEPLEAIARSRDPGAVFAVERNFTEFRSRIIAQDIDGAEQLRDAIEAGLPRIVALTTPTGSPTQAFIESLLIILREGLEAILVIGAIVALLIKTGHRERLRSIWVGVGMGLVASVLTAIVLKTVLSSIPASREIIEGVTMLAAVAVLFSVSYWLISKVEAAKWQQFIKDRVTHALEHGGGRALAIVAFLAVYREGAETALLFQVRLNEGSHTPILLGILVGGVALAIIFTLFYRYGLRIPLRPFFAVTSALLYYMAFVFTGKGITELQEGGAVSASFISGFPVIESLGIYNTWETLLAQLVLLALFAFAVAKTFWPKRSVALPTVAQPSTGPDLSSEISAMRAEHAELRKRITELEQR